MLKKYQRILKDSDFSETYENIMKIMSFSKGMDIDSRDKLHEIFSMGHYSLDSNLHKFEVLIKTSDNIFIFGGGPDSLLFINLYKNTLTKLIQNYNILIIAIDGFTEILFENDIIPDIVFTDLDGIALKSVQDKKFNSTMFIIHAHGHNINKINEFKTFISNAKFKIGTTQNKTKIPIINHGGFTDGDRCLFLLSNFLVENQNVYLVGYDFGNIVGKHSKLKFVKNMTADRIKSKKLNIGMDLTYEICLLWPCTTNLIEIDYEVNSKYKSNQAKSKFNIIRLKKEGDLINLVN